VGHLRGLSFRLLESHPHKHTHTHTHTCSTRFTHTYMLTDRTDMQPPWLRSCSVLPDRGFGASATSWSRQTGSGGRRPEADALCSRCSWYWFCYWFCCVNEIVGYFWGYFCNFLSAVSTWHRCIFTPLSHELSSWIWALLGAHREIMVLKWFFKRCCGSTKNHHLLKNLFEGSLRNYLRKWFFKEPWVERFFEAP